MTSFEDDIHFDKLVTLICSDGKKMHVSRNRLMTSKYFEVIFKDEPELKEIKIVHTSKDFSDLLRFMVHINYERDDIGQDDITTLSKLLNYYQIDTTQIPTFICAPEDLAFISPGSEEHLRSHIEACIEEHAHVWPHGLKISKEIKAIVYDTMIDLSLNGTDIKVIE